MPFCVQLSVLTSFLGVTNRIVISTAAAKTMIDAITTTLLVLFMTLISFCELLFALLIACSVQLPRPDENVDALL